VKRDLEVFGVDENVAFDQRRWRQIIASPTPILKGKYGLSKKMIDDDCTTKSNIIQLLYNVLILNSKFNCR